MPSGASAPSSPPELADIARDFRPNDALEWAFLDDGSTVDEPTPAGDWVDFLRCLDPEGRHNLVVIRPEKVEGARVAEGRTFASGDYEGMRGFIDYYEGHRGLYVSVNEPKEEAPDGKLDKGEIGTVRAVYLDLDPEKDEEAKPGGFERERERLWGVIEELRAGPIPPSAIVDSGSGYHAYWFLSEKLPAAEHGAWAEAQVRALVERFGGDPSSPNIDRVLRLPGTTNLPNKAKRDKGRKPSQSRLLYLGAERYSRETLSAWIPPIGKTEGAAAEGKRKSPPPVGELDLPYVIEFARKWLLDEAPVAQEGAGGRRTTMGVIQTLGDFGLSADMIFELLTEEGGWDEMKAVPRWAASIEGLEELNDLVHDLWHRRNDPIGCRRPPPPIEEAFEAVDLGEAHEAAEAARAKAREERAKAEEERVKAHAAREEARAKADEARAKAEEFRARGDEEQAQAEEARAKAEEARAKPTSRLMKAALRANEEWGFTDRPYLVKGILGQGILALTYGPSNIGKSFMVIDRALHIAMGREYAGRRVNQTGGIYFMLEGGKDAAKNRRQAWFDYYGIGEADAEKIPFVIVPAHVDLLDPNADLRDVVDMAVYYGREFGIPIGHIVIDTVSAAFGAGDEVKDAGGALTNARALISATNATVELVHHTGKNADAGARGSSKFFNDVDAQFVVTEATGGHIRVKAKKQRDDGKNGELEFKLKEIQIGVDRDGDPVTSLVAVRLNPFDEPEIAPLTPTEQSILDVVLALAEEKAGDDGVPEAEVVKTGEVVEAVKANGMKMTRQTISGHLAALSEKGRLSKAGQGSWRVIGG